MAPSRAFQGFNCLVRSRVQPFYNRKDARHFSDLARAVADPSNKCQVYTSRSPNPYLNLSIEHYILQKSPADSTILFLYTNRPSVVIGRNQNPWTECNLGVLRNQRGPSVGLQDEEHKVQLVRRRSGGGTVYHDAGNVNYSVIMPTSEFDRDKHAEMVGRALRELGVEKVRVNERHDIVVDRKPESEREDRPFKISGSAYKLTRVRSLHHGTCLLKGSNIGVMSELLHAPAKPFITAKGVESVRSSVTQVDVNNEQFEAAVRHEFWKMYSHSKAMMVGRAEGEIPEIKKGVEELMSEDWTYGQTPPFEFSINESYDSALSESSKWNFPQSFELKFSARNGVINELSIYKKGVGNMITSSIKGKKLHEIRDWNLVLAAPFKKSYPEKSRDLVRAEMGRSLNRLFGNGDLMVEEYTTRR
ncbi:related to lipoyltransferase [Rhynchosporium agropyri]|uniref:Putative lipoate-protein ligase A n=1 Tax=Rhynchosporium agropyri TaxID=914238 RepID=A0A1E1LRG1_9HELO|nr:related to lipoyltransferase [Rhynchosporium agropyri]